MYYRELSSGLDASNNCLEPDTNTHLKSSQSNYSFNSNAKLSNQSLQKHRITKSSTTCFNKENVNGSANSSSSNAHYQNMASNNSTGYFGHSNSYDNMRALKNTSLIKERDHVNLNNNNNNNNNNTSSPNNTKLHVTPTNLNSSINNNSNCSSTSNSSDQIVLHVRNLDYKISADEWKRILLENFRKHCKEVKTHNSE